MLYSDNRYRTRSNIKQKVGQLKQATIVLEGGSDANDATAAIKEGKSIARGQCSECSPQRAQLAPHGQRPSESHIQLARRVHRMHHIEEGRLQMEGDGCILGSGEGERDPPKIYPFGLHAEGEEEKWGTEAWIDGRDDNSNKDPEDRGWKRSRMWK